MASENHIKNILDLLTSAPKATIESLPSAASDHRKNMRSVIQSKNIIGIGISEKISKKKSTGKLALTFYVQKKIPMNKLKASEAIPPTVSEALSGNIAVPTDVIVIGKFKPDANASRKFFQPGNSIGHILTGAGTFGAVVASGKWVYILSNSHVLAMSGKAKVGDPVLYPGERDGGINPEDIVAKLHKFKKFTNGGEFVNLVDCALAKPNTKQLPKLMSEIRELGLPKGTIKPKRGMKIVKVGRTTAKTVGEIKDINFRFELDYEIPGLDRVAFKDQALCTRYSKAGDSGALVIDQATGKAVGLHFASAEGGSVFNPIDQVLNALGVKLVTKSLAKK